MAGTFDIFPQIVVRTGTWTISGGAGSDSSILSGLGGTLSANDTSNLAASLDCINNDITVDGVAGQSINSLPVGFNLSSINIQYNYTPNAPTGNLAIFKFLFNQEAVASLGNGLIDNPGNQVGSINFSVVGLTFADLFGDHWVVSLQFKVQSFGELFSISKFKINGAYNTIAGSFSLPSQGPFKVGDNVTINASQNLDGIVGIVISYISPISKILTSITITSFVSQSATKLVFTIPNQSDLTTISLNNVAIYGTGNGIQFSGSVMLGTINIYVADPSGLYVLTTGKFTDTIYNKIGLRATITGITILEMFADEETLFEPEIINPKLITTNGPDDDIEIDNGLSGTVATEPFQPYTYIISPVTQDVNILDPFFKTGFLP